MDRKADNSLLGGARVICGAARPALRRRRSSRKTVSTEDNFARRPAPDEDNSPHGAPMPSGMAAWIVQTFKEQDVTGLELEESPYSKTGYTNIIEVKGKYQARLQVKDDGTRKRRQYSLPGLFDTAKEAAQYLAIVKRDRRGTVCDDDGLPMKQNKQHKPLPQPPQPPPQLPMLQLPMATAMATPIAFPLPYAPMVPVSPLPMQPLCQAPPMWPVRM